ncbi:MAG TPA: hypothetical protein PLF85_11550, partial [Turneriella sp.]|nr:hypothetical protein [Turneriella sp.]
MAFPKKSPVRETGRKEHTVIMPHQPRALARGWWVLVLLTIYLLDSIFSIMKRENKTQYALLGILTQYEC